MMRGVDQNLGRSIVLIEDDSDDIEIIQHTLEAIGVEVPLRVFSSAKQAVAYFKTAKDELPRLILCDMHVNGDSGAEIWKTIAAERAIAGLKVPFIFLTTGTVESRIAEAYSLPVHGVFLKQTSMDKCIEQMRAILTYWSFALLPENGIKPARWTED